MKLGGKFAAWWAGVNVGSAAGAAAVELVHELLLMRIKLLLRQLVLWLDCCCWRHVVVHCCNNPSWLVVGAEEGKLTHSSTLQ